jgi:hypothetical protein
MPTQTIITCPGSAGAVKPNLHIPAIGINANTDGIDYRRTGACSQVATS